MVMACTMLFSVFLDNLHMGSNIAMDSVVIKDRGEHEGRLILKKGEERRLLSGHLWVFSKGRNLGEAFSGDSVVCFGRISAGKVSGPGDL